MAVQANDERQLTCVHSLWCYIFVVCAYSTLASCQSSTLSVVYVRARVVVCASVRVRVPCSAFRPPFLVDPLYRKLLALLGESCGWLFGLEFL